MISASLLLFLKKVGAWFKRWWKLVLGFTLALGGIVAVKIIVDSDDTDPTIPIPDFNEEGNKAVEDVVKAAEERDAKLLELAEKHKSRLEELTNNQDEELEALVDKPIEEVVAWFDRL